MASLTPGTLLKLLQNVGNKDFKVAGEHRSALLQVISIVPSMEDDIWKSRGYFLRVSDSKHSAYVSVSDEDVELILSDKIKLGQFIHVTRFDSGSPVPVLRGMKPISKRQSCVGDPKDLISSDFLNARKVEKKVKSNEKVKKVMGGKNENNRRLSMGNGNVVGVENRRLSLDSSRKAWDKSPQSKNGGKGVKPKTKDDSSSPNSVITSKVILKNSPSTPRISPLKSKNTAISPKLLPKPIMKITKPSEDDMLPSYFKKVAFSPKKLSDSKIAWNFVSATVSDLGKEVRNYRNVAFVSASSALEEASIFESVIWCMSMFAELCESSQNDSCGPLLEKYLNLHECMKKAAEVIHIMINARNANKTDNVDYSSKCLEPRDCLSSVNMNASLWVQAAVETDLSRLSLYTEGREKGITNGKNRHYVMIESASEKTIHSPKNKQTPPNKSLQNVKSHSRTRLSKPKQRTNGHEEWSPGSGLRSSSILAEKLISSSRAWFLDYLENSLNNGFGLKSGEDSSRIAVVLGLLKRVNQWLDDSYHGGEGVDERIERLKKKLYRFLLDHVDSSASSK